MDKDNEILYAVIATLELVEVHGADNLDRLLGCINALKGLSRQIEQRTREVTENG